MKKILTFLTLFLLLGSTAFSEKLPFDKSMLKESYTMNNGNTIYIEQYERGNSIWEKDSTTNTFKHITYVWYFLALAERCEGIKEENIYFAENLEYYLGGGNNIDNPQIRIFSLHNPRPWRTNDLGIVPDMEWTKQWCVFYEKKIK